MQMYSYTNAKGKSYCILGFRNDEERSRMLTVLGKSDCLLNTLSMRMRFSDLIRHLDRRCTSGCSLPAASSCIVLRSEEMDELMAYVLGMLEEAATQHEHRAAQDRQLEKLCRDPRFDEQDLFGIHSGHGIRAVNRG